MWQRMWQRMIYGKGKRIVGLVVDDLWQGEGIMATDDLWQGEGIVCLATDDLWQGEEDCWFGSG
ncbi:MAG: hypothetical protein QNJ36_10255 [Calothrix sp. MO_167.B42]|nr:hypothetical protein [Calothrix sp. MO_167.B42]